MKASGGNEVSIRIENMYETEDGDFDWYVVTEAAYRGGGRRHGVQKGALVTAGGLQGRVKVVFAMGCRVKWFHKLGLRVPTSGTTVHLDKKFDFRSWARKNKPKKQDEDDGAEWTPESDPNEDQSDRR
ncbi:MAG: hypothetical protein JRI25_11915 [Deltaproteobacteria bacterium]|nr:hypothetical protein [Deltaproteobacteria bacterium]MBW2255291.1 hypothetical protein [Deltaproteobacteria bacterium]